MKFKRRRRQHGSHHIKTHLDVTTAPLKRKLMIHSIESDDADMVQFLFTLGCSTNQHLTIISDIGNHFIIEMHGARYSIDRALAECILVSDVNAEAV